MVSPGYTWLYVFLPALTYFIVTRISFGRDVGVGIPLIHSSGVFCQDTGPPILPSCTTTTTTSPQWFRVAHDWGIALSDSLWRHDDELGRGYLIASDASGAGRIWRWEVGGGPIAIGSTLHMDQAGCRSKSEGVCSDPHGKRGVTALATEPSSSGESPLLVIAEHGEGRIVRIEATTGARTPLLLLDNQSIVSSMVYTATGDLFYTIHQSSEEPTSYQLMRLALAVHTEALPSLSASRVAHEWKSLPANHSASVPYPIHPSTIPLSWIGGLAANATMLFYPGILEDSGEAVLMRIQLEQDDDFGEDEGDDDDAEFELRPILHVTLPNSGSSSQLARPTIALSNEGTLFVVFGDALWILTDGRLSEASGRFPLPTTDPISSLTVGGDGYLYVTSGTDLYRIRTMTTSPVHLPQGRIPKKQKTAVIA